MLPTSCRGSESTTIRRNARFLTVAAWSSTPRNTGLLPKVSMTSPSRILSDSGSDTRTRINIMKVNEKKSVNQKCGRNFTRKDRFNAKDKQSESNSKRIAICPVPAQWWLIFSLAYTILSSRKFCNLSAMIVFASASLTSGDTSEMENRMNLMMFPIAIECCRHCTKY